MALASVVEWRPGQREVVDAIASAIESGEPVVIEAYPGVGKTLAALYAAVSKGVEALFVVRTHEEMGVYMQEARRLGRVVVPLLARYGFCPRLKGLPRSVFYEICRALRERGACDEFNRAVWRSTRVEGAERVIDAASRASTPDDVAREVAEAGFCPFTSSLVAARMSDLVTCTYPYMVEKGLRHVWSAVSRGRFVVLDEAHTLLTVYAESFRNIPPEEAESILRGFVRELRRIAAQGGRVDEELARVVEEGATAARLVMDREKRRRRRVALRDAVERVCNALELVTGESVEFVKGSFVVTPQEPPKPEPPFAAMSGFVPETLVRLLGFSGRVIEVTPPEPLVELTIVDSVTTRFREYGAEQVRRLSDELATILRSCEKPVLVVFPSKRVAEDVCGALFVRHDIDLMQFAAWRREVDLSWSVFVDVAGGRLSEGVNIPLRTVIVVGLPYPSPSPALRAFASRHGFEAVEDLMMVRLVQAIGRGTRARARVYILDYRARELRLPEWVGSRA